jgi:putative CocE/NonD family hydrolase
VRVWVGGEDRWRELQTWPPADAQPYPLYLQPGGALRLAPPPEHAEPGRYRYDPMHPTPAVGGPVLLARSPVTDNRELEARPDLLTYTTEPLERDVVAIGPVSADIHFRSTLEHTDVFVRLCDVLPDGRSLNVCDALVRLLPGAPAAEADGSRRVHVDLWPTAHRFRSGHRMRVQISSGAHPRYARNPGTGEDPATATRLVVADQEVLHDAAHPSGVTLSVVEGGVEPVETVGLELAPPAPVSEELAPLEPELRSDARFERRLFVREILIILLVAVAVVAWSTLR